MSPTDTSVRRARLDHEAVLEAAEALLDDHGIDSITMTMLASELGTKASSLYNHVASLEHLRSELQIRAMRQLGHELRRAAMGVSGDEGLRALAETFLRFARTYPHRYDAMTRPILDREKLFVSSADVIEALAAMVGSAGVPKEGVLNAQMAFFAALHGFNALESSGFFAPDDGRDIDFDAVYAQLVRGAVSAMLDEV
jgi:AcrR family transcriptional regulator